MALSKTQTRKLGILLGIMFGEELDDIYIQEMIEGGYVKLEGRNYKLTEAGLSEKNRLTTLCGLNIKYSSERKKEKSLDAEIKKSL
jgi:predicted transcriptional regulator